MIKDRSTPPIFLIGFLKRSVVIKKALDVEKIREEVKEASIAERPPPEVKKDTKPKPKKEETPKEKPKRKEEPVDEEALMLQFEAETKKKAIWRGKPTKGYLDWKETKSG